MAQSILNDGIPLKFMLKKFKNTFTREDYNFWKKKGFLYQANQKLEEYDDDEELIDELIDKGKKYIKNMNI